MFEHVDTKTCPVGIVGVAIKQNGKVYSLGAPMRHGDLMKAMIHKGVPPPINGIEGFKLANGKFADRVEGRNIAVRAGQVKDTINVAWLSSEDLW